MHNYKFHLANKNVTLLTNPTTAKETSEMQNNIINIHYSSTSDKKQFDEIMERIPRNQNSRSNIRFNEYTLNWEILLRLSGES